ncbi:MAG: hypothetical protein ABIK42_04190, partial [candidate division WOR-3 bacterium]
MDHIANFCADELHQIADQGLLNNRPIATSMGGHLHFFRNGRLRYDTDTICDYYVLGAAKEGYISVFHIYDVVELRIAYSYNEPFYTFTGLYSYQGSENAPADYKWYFGDASPPEHGSPIRHQFRIVTNDTLYKVSLVVTTVTGRQVWTTDTIRVKKRYAWVERHPIPRYVKDGGWLTYNSDNGLIYAARGYKSGDFYCYDPSANEWTRLNSWPLGGEGRLPYRGSAGCYGGGYIWAVKGNNTRGFWRYSVTHNTWQQLESIPRGNSGRNPKGGTDVVYVVLNDTGYVYLLKGYKQDFMRYNTISGRWQQLPNAPDGVKPKWDRGSWLVYDGVNTLYAHKAKYHELWTFDLTTGQWDTIPLQGMPFISGITGRSKKSKDGGSAAYYNGFIYALKGGNTCQFWRYDIANNSWIELDPMPDFGSTGEKKRVRGGGNITCANGTFYAFKGGKTAEFWRYLPSSEEGQSKFLIASSGTSPSGKVEGGESPIAEGVDAYCPRFRADGGAVCYSREDQNGWLQVFMAFRNMPNSEVQLTFEPTEHETPVFDHSGTWIAMSMEDEATGYYQIAKVQANPNPGPCTVLTDGEEDAEFPEWSPAGNHIVFQRYDTLTGYIQLFRVLANGGETEQLTFEDADCEKPVYLNQNEIVFHRWPDEGYIQVCKLNL